MANVHTPQPFGELLGDKASLAAVTQGFLDAIADSYRTDASRREGYMRTQVTDTETRRRFALCERWFRTFRAEYGWGVRRSVEMLPSALRADLDGLKFGRDEPEVSTWVPRGSEVEVQVEENPHGVHDEVGN